MIFINFINIFYEINHGFRNKSRNFAYNFVEWVLGNPI